MHQWILPSLVQIICIWIKLTYSTPQEVCAWMSSVVVNYIYIFQGIFLRSNIKGSGLMIKWIYYPNLSWRCHQMETFFALLFLCAGNSPVTSKFPSQRPVMQSFDVFFDLCLNKLFSKKLWGWWFETPSHSLWHHCNYDQSKTKHNTN